MQSEASAIPAFNVSHPQNRKWTLTSAPANDASEIYNRSVFTMATEMCCEMKKRALHVEGQKLWEKLIEQKMNFSWREKVCFAFKFALIKSFLSGLMGNFFLLFVLCLFGWNFFFCENEFISDDGWWRFHSLTMSIWRNWRSPTLILQ